MPGLHRRAMPNQPTIPANKNTMCQRNGNSNVFTIGIRECPSEIWKHKIPIVRCPRLVLSPDRKALTGVVDIVMRCVGQIYAKIKAVRDVTKLTAAIHTRKPLHTSIIFQILCNSQHTRHSNSSKPRTRCDSGPQYGKIFTT